MSYMFSYCSSLTSLNLSNFNTDNVNDMGDIFKSLNINCEVISNDNQILELLLLFFYNFFKFI